MSATRKRIAQLCIAVAAAAMFLPWNINAGLSDTVTVRGISTGVGRIVFVVCLATVVLVQMSWRPAWIGAGLATAFAGREIFDPSAGGSAEPGSGVWVAVAAAALTVVFLAWDMFAGVAAGEGRDPAEPPRWFFSGPLGRRR